jgi:hypothetical protein
LRWELLLRYRKRQCHFDGEFIGIQIFAEVVEIDLKLLQNRFEIAAKPLQNRFKATQSHSRKS